MATQSESRPEWAWNVYNAWRKRHPDACSHPFEACGWFQSESAPNAWCRQNATGGRIEVYENGKVNLKTGVRSWL